MIGFPHRDVKGTYDFITRQTKDRESKEDFEFPAEYMFKEVPEKDLRDVDDPVALTLAEMDTWGVARGMISVSLDDPDANGNRALREHPDRFVASISVDPNDGMDALRQMQRAAEEHDIRAIGMFPSGTFPQVAINDKKMYPIYAKCL
jgi:uncharacterized protein